MQDDRIAAVLDLVWRSFSGPLFYAALELWVAARTDPELHENLYRFERGVGRAMAQLWQELAWPLYHSMHSPVSVSVLDSQPEE